MEYYLTLNNETIGPFKKEDIIQKLKLGEISYDTYCWKEGWDEWKLIQTIFPPQLPKVENVIAENSANTIEQDYVSAEESYSTDENESIPQKANNHSTEARNTRNKNNTHPLFACAILVIVIAVTAVALTNEFLENKKDSEQANKNKSALTVNTSKSTATPESNSGTSYISSSTEFEKMMIYAKNGDPNSQTNLGYCYQNGQGVQKDEAEAVKWYRKAADQGLALAQTNLGYCYQNGQGVQKDDTEAVKWYSKAADQGAAKAQKNLGFCYAIGKGVQKDEAEAVKWYRKAAEQGDAWAQTNLGYCYQNGQGVQKDDIEAVKWYSKAAEQGDAWAQTNLGFCYDNGSGVQKDEAEAVKWYRKAAEQGDAKGQNIFGVCLYSGTGLAKDEAEAVKWFRKAAEQGDGEAQKNLGVCYQNGIGVTKDRAEAKKWFRKAAEKGNIDARTFLGSYDKNSKQSVADSEVDTNKKPIQNNQNPENSNDPDQKVSQFLNRIDQMKNQNPSEVGQDFINNTSESVIDNEPEKYNGPATKIILQFVLADANKYGSQNQALVGMGAQMYNALEIKVKEIKRGKPVRSAISRSIPAGTELFPIRVAFDGGLVNTLMNSQMTFLTGAPAQDSNAITADLYFYKDAFGDWNAIKKD